jgi:hypothetical protein
MRPAVYIILAVVAVQRLAEVVYAERNTRALRGRGAVEVGRGHYPLIVVLHAAWLMAIVLWLPVNAMIFWPALHPAAGRPRLGHRHTGTLLDDAYHHTAGGAARPQWALPLCPPPELSRRDG